MKSLLSILKRGGFVIYNKPYQLNIVGVRSIEPASNKFDDKLHVKFINGQGKTENYTYNITTDPGTYWLQHPMQVDGTAILKQGQYVDAYKIGLHRGQYKALVQAKPVTIIRDYDRNAILDFNNGKESTGLFGINIHRASIHGATKTVGKWSAGCQVFEKNSDFLHFMSLCEKHRSLYGNHFTYTLLDFRYLKRMSRRYTLYGTAGLATFLFLLTQAVKHFRKPKNKKDKHEKK